MVSIFLFWALFLVIIHPFILVEASVRVMSTNETLQSQTSYFGPRISAYGILGHVYEPLYDTRGCQQVQTQDTQWIALLKRGGCSFLQKVQAMQQSGAIAVIVGDESSSEWITMTSEDDTFDIRIPSVFLPQNEYQQLLYAQQQRQPLLVLLEGAEMIPRSTTIIMNYPYIMIPLCPLLFLILFWILIQQRKQYKASLYLYYEQQQQQLSLTHTTLNEADLELCLPRQYASTTDSNTMANNDALECAICLDHFDEGAEYRRLSCQHIFHTTCIDPWLTGYKSSCPVCNRETTI